MVLLSAGQTMCLGSLRAGIAKESRLEAESPVGVEPGHRLKEYVFYYLASIPLLGVVAQWLAWRLRLPSILLLLVFGVALGYFMRHYVAPGDVGSEIIPEDFLFPIVSLSVAVILFEGGLSLRLAELKQSGGLVLRLVTVGALLTWVLTALAASWLLGLSGEVAALVGAVLVVTGPTVVAPLLRHIRPARRIGSIVKWEGIVIDPIGAVLAVLVFEAVLAGGMRQAAHETALILAKTLFFGVLIGLAAAMVLIQLLARYWISDFLHSPTFLATALGGFAVSEFLQHECGLVTVTVMGVALANQKAVAVKHIIEFKENLQVLLISALFIVLGSRIKVASFVDLGWQGLAFIAVLILMVRPISVWLATLGSDLNVRERWFLSFLAPRGIVAAAVSSVFAFKLIESGRYSAELSDQLVSITFLAIVCTVAVYGLSAAPLARWLKLAEPNPQGILFVGAEAWVRQIAKLLQREGFQVLLVDTNYFNISTAKMEGLQAHCASILAEYVREDLDLSGIGKLLAMTANDHVNTLAVNEFAPLFGRANVYQLRPWEPRDKRRQSTAEHLRGRLLFGEGLHHDKLANLMQHGGQLKKTKLTAEFTYDSFQEMYGDKAILLFVISERGKLIICTSADAEEAVPGTSVIALLPSESEAPLETSEATRS